MTDTILDIVAAAPGNTVSMADLCEALFQSGASIHDIPAATDIAKLRADGYTVENTATGEHARSVSPKWVVSL